MTKFRDINKEMPYYFAFGSNLSHRQMRQRCSNSRPIAKLVLKKHALVFRGVADMIKDKDASIPGGLYKVTRDCERKLDFYEGLSAGVYRKKYFLLKWDETTDKVCFYYQMRAKGMMPPTEKYLDTIAQGYVDFHLDIDKLADAVQYAWDNPDLTDAMQERFQRMGKPKLATPEYLYRDQVEEVEPEQLELLGDVSGYRVN